MSRISLKDVSLCAGWGRNADDERKEERRGVEYGEEKRETMEESAE